MQLHSRGARGADRLELSLRVRSLHRDAWAPRLLCRNRVVLRARATAPSLRWLRSPDRFRDYPVFFPELLISVVLALDLCGGVTRHLRVGREFAALLIMSLGVTC